MSNHYHLCIETLTQTVGRAIHDLCCALNIGHAEVHLEDHIIDPQADGGIRDPNYSN
jgi:hypothetical protein